MKINMFKIQHVFEHMIYVHANIVNHPILAHFCCFLTRSDKRVVL